MYYHLTVSLQHTTNSEQSLETYLQINTILLSHIASISEGFVWDCNGLGHNEKYYLSNSGLVTHKILAMLDASQIIKDAECGQMAKHSYI